MNKVVKIAGNFTLRVKGIYKDQPQNSSFNQTKFAEPIEALVKQIAIRKFYSCFINFQTGTYIHPAVK